MQWSTFDQYNDQPNHDLDMYVFYCPGFDCTQVGGSFGLTADESVGLIQPATNGVAADPNDADDPYAVFIHGFNTVGGATANGFLFDWTVVDDEGNMTVTGPTSATLGATGTVNLDVDRPHHRPGREAGRCRVAQRRQRHQGPDHRQHRERRRRRLLRPGGVRPVTGLH